MEQKDQMTEIQQKVANLSNIYLAYIRVKNELLNRELVLDQDISYFELNLDENLKKIYKNVSSPDFIEWEFQPFDFVLKYKNIDHKNGEEVNYRPLVRLSFKDQVYIQSIFNVIMDELRNFLPKENLGVQLMPGNSVHIYKGWNTQYKKFVSQQRKNYAKNTVYRTCFEYDIEQFFPSVSQDILLEDLREMLCIDQDDIVYQWLKQIIKYYAVNNISKDTKRNYDFYVNSMAKKNIDENDLGLPQGALYSSFLASLYTRGIYSKIKKHYADKGVLCDFFSYVDDGRIYLSEDETKDNIEEFVEKTLQEINEQSKTKKKLRIKESKTTLFQIVDRSSLSKLDYLLTDVSMTNLSVNPNFDVDQDIVNTALAKYESLKEKIDDLYPPKNPDGPIESKELEKEKLEKEKLEKEMTTLLKRRASFLTRKISNDDNFYDIVNRLYDVNDSEVEVYIIAGVKPDITTFNYYYNLKNLLESANNDEHKLEYLCEKLKDYLDYYLQRFDKKGIHFYILSTIKACYEAEYSSCLQKLIEWIYENYHDNDGLVLKFFMSFLSLPWHQAMHEKFKGKMFSGTSLEDEAIKHYFDSPYLFEKDKDYIHDESGHANSLEKSEILSSLNVQIEPFTKSRKGAEFTSFKTCRDDSAYLSILVDHWIKFYQKYKYIRPGYLVLNNIFIKKDEDKVIIFDDTSYFFDEYELKKYDLNYKEFFKKLFFEYFNCGEVFLVNKKGSSLKFWEYRILAYLSNKWFDLNDFFEILSDSLKRQDLLNHEVDGNFERIRMIVDENLKTAKDKDTILLLHYYVHCSWKNGSKDLYFYTLHNEEHSLVLIQNYLEISKRIFNKLSLTRNERFILFCACYLHDIGMLISLNEEEKYDIGDTRIIEFYNANKKYISDEHSSSKMEEILMKIYTLFSKTEQLNENIVRGDHGVRSSLEIQHDNGLPLSDLEKSYVAIVSGNHMLDVNAVYGIENRVEYRDTSIDIRKISIWLRLLDLTDMTKYRVTQEVFNKCFDQMGKDSKFHWIRHLSVDDVKFSTTLDTSEKEEKIKLKIEILYNYLPPEEKIEKKCSKDCKYCYKKYDNENESFKTKPTQYIAVRYDKNAPVYNCDLRKSYIQFANWFDQEIDYINQYCKIHDNKFEVTLIYELNEKTKRDDFEIVTIDRKHKDPTNATTFVRNYLQSKKN